MTNKIELLFNILVSMLNIGISQLCDLACRGSIISAGYDRLCMMLLEKRVVDGWETRLCGNFILFVITYVNNSAVRTGLDGTISGEALNFGHKNKS